jgi:ATP-dependent Zn protease
VSKQPSRALASAAHHEAGHAVMCCKERIRVNRITIIPSEGATGSVGHANPLHGINLECDGSTRARMRVESYVKVCLAGPVAQRAFNPKGYRRYHGQDDYRQAEDVLSTMVGSYEEREAYLRLLYIQTKQYITSPAGGALVSGVAAALLERKEIPPP